MIFTKMFSKTTIPLLDKVASFTEKRHQVIANNIANQNTWGFKAQDLDIKRFNELLIRAIDNRRQIGSIGQFDFPSSLSIGIDSNGFLKVRYIDEPNPGLLKHNQNNVDAGRQQARLAKNTLLNSLALELLRKQYAMLETAISERV